MKKHSFGLALLLMAWLAGSVRCADTASVETRRKELSRLLVEEWEYEMRESPEFATVIGDYRYNDRWSDNSLAHVPQQRADLEKWRARFVAIDTTGFPEQEKLNQVLMVRNLKMRVQEIDLKLFEMPIDQFFGAHLQIAQFVSFMPFQTAKQYDDYLARLHGVPALVDHIIEVLRQGRVRRAKLYYLRGRSGKSARIAERARSQTQATETAAE